MSQVRRRQGLASGSAARVRRMWTPNVGDGRYGVSGHAHTTADVVPGHVVGHQPEDRRDRLAGRVEVDEAYIGGLEEGVRGRQTEKKALIAVAAEEDGEGIGRIRMRRIPDATADSLQTFVEEAVAPGSLLHTDGLLSYDRMEKHGYRHRITFLKGRKESASALLPRVHRVVSLLKRWLLGTHQGAVSRAHLDYYLDEFTFRFNRRTSRHRGKLFYRLVQQAVAVAPAPYASLVKHVRPRKRRRRHPNK